MDLMELKAASKPINITGKEFKEMFDTAFVNGAGEFTKVSFDDVSDAEVIEVRSTPQGGMEYFRSGGELL